MDCAVAMTIPVKIRIARMVNDWRSGFIFKVCVLVGVGVGVGHVNRRDAKTQWFRRGNAAKIVAQTLRHSAFAVKKIHVWLCNTKREILRTWLRNLYFTLG